MPHLRRRFITREVPIRWLLLLTLIACALSAQAEFDYALQPRQIAEDVWLVEGSTDNFAQNNGGNIVNSGFIVTEQGVLVIDSAQFEPLD